MPTTALSPAGGLSPSNGRGGAVKSTDQEKKARAVVSERLRLFFSQLQEHVASSAGAFWKRVETKANDSKPEG
jgi:hypothetical protein